MFSTNQLLSKINDKRATILEKQAKVEHLKMQINSLKIRSSLLDNLVNKTNSLIDHTTLSNYETRHASNVDSTILINDLLEKIEDHADLIQNGTINRLDLDLSELQEYSSHSLIKSLATTSTMNDLPKYVIKRLVLDSLESTKSELLIKFDELSTRSNPIDHDLYHLNEIKSIESEINRIQNLEFPDIESYGDLLYEAESNKVVYTNLECYRLYNQDFYICYKSFNIKIA